MTATDSTPRFLIVRLSSIGDIIQCLDVPKAIKSVYPESSIHWVTKKEFADLIDQDPNIDHVWKFDRSTGFKGWLKLIDSLKPLQFSHIYDAHNNLRSNILSKFLRSPHFIRRPKNRWKRWLLFQFQKNLFPEKRFVGRKSFLEPLQGWGISGSPTSMPNMYFSDKVKSRIDALDLPNKFVALIPSAAWEMKTWPLEHWQTLINSHPETSFVILGGPADRHLEPLISHPNTISVIGKLSLAESCGLLARASTVIGNDTGLMHAADQLGVPTLALIGPTAFGYPASSKSQPLEIQLDCKPCSKDGRGRCKNSVYKRCLKDLSPSSVGKELERLLR